MSDIAIRVQNLSKLYRIGARERYYSLRDTLTDTLAQPFRKFSSLFGRYGSRRSTSEPHLSFLDSSTIWALKDVSFEVKPGEVVGIIGRNGAGKSTLLKVLSRITEPTEGRAEVYGSVGPLLEVGTGFHPELTGRENIYLNGAILGMKKAEINRKFDEIVAFAEVEKFIDTPVKRYSSGMYVRLAFAVAAYLEPEILLVDEVLATGDAAFQKKCLGKMGKVAKEGRTVLFVSHNMGAVSSLCHRAIMLSDGSIVDQGAPEAVVRRYVDLAIPRDSGSEIRVEERPDLDFQILGVAVTDAQGKPIASAGLWEQTFIRVDFLVRKELFGSEVAMWITRDGIRILETWDTDLALELAERRAPGYYRAIIPLPCCFPAGIYTVGVGTGMHGRGGSIDLHYDVVFFEVVATEDTVHKSYSRPAIIIARIPWRTRRVGSVPVLVEKSSR